MEEQERHLIELAQAGNLNAFERLIRKVDKRVLTLVYRMLNNTEDAEDVYQEVFLKVYSNLKGFRFQSDFYTWVYRIAVRCAVDYRKRRSKRPVASIHELDGSQEGWTETATAPPAPDAAACGAELRERFQELLESLPAMQRAVLFLRFMEDLPIRDIAAATGCSRGAVKQHLFRGMRKAKKALSAYRA
jgi:RNA polymerase sigma-70 factor, ECF subfamily